jgi:DNA-binding transcriptional LysR family regulator
MDKFLISPDDCLILKAFRDSKSLREAAQLLECDPAGLARRVQGISSQYGFLQKVNNRWQLTARGLDLVAWTEASIQTQKKVLSVKSSLRIGSTTWFTEEVLIPNVRGLKDSIGDLPLHFSVPDKEFQLALIDGSVDLVIVCHPPESPEIEHRQLADEAWALIAPADWRKELLGKKAGSLEELVKRPFVRHSDLNTDLFLPDGIGPVSESGITVDHLVGVRSAVRAGHGWSIVPRLLVHRHLQAGLLIEFDHQLTVKDRRVCLWWLRNRMDMKRLAGKVGHWVKDICS